MANREKKPSKGAASSVLSAELGDGKGVCSERYGFVGAQF